MGACARSKTGGKCDARSVVAAAKERVAQALELSAEVTMLLTVVASSFSCEKLYTWVHRASFGED